MGEDGGDEIERAAREPGVHQLVVPDAPVTLAALAASAQSFVGLTTGAVWDGAGRCVTCGSGSGVGG